MKNLKFPHSCIVNGLASGVFAGSLFLPISAALALPSNATKVVSWGGIIRTIEERLNDVETTLGTADRIRNRIGNLSKRLGVEIGGDGKAEGIEQVLSVYRKWYIDKLSPEDKSTVSWLVMEYARENKTSFQTVSSSEWFLQKTQEEQARVGAVFFDFEEIIDVVGNERPRFLSYAFCINSGQDSCKD